MAKLPTRESLGGLPNSRRGGTLAQVSPAVLPRGASVGAIGAGVSNIGTGFDKTGQAANIIELQDRKRQEFETEQQFQQFDWSARQSLDASMRSIEPGTARTFPDAATQSYQESAKEFFKNVPEHLKPQYEAKLFSTERDLYGAATTFARGEQKRFSVESIDKTGETVFRPKARVTPTDELDKVVAESDRLIDANPDLTPIERDVLKQKERREIAKSHIDALPPDQAQALISGRLTGAADAVTDKIIKVESGGRYNATNENSSASGPGQFIKSTWLDMVKRNRPDVAEGRTDQELLALRTDPKYAGLSREMTAAYAAENSAKLQKAGLPTTPGNVYLAHFLGPAGATKVLTADPSTPVSSLVTADAFNANRRIMEGKTAGDLAAWSDRKMGGTATGALSSLTDDDWKQAQAQADTRLRALRVDQEHQIQLAKAQAKQVSDEAEGELLKGIYGNDPAVTSMTIANDKRLEVSARERMIKLMEHVGRADRTTATYGNEFFNLFQRIHAPEGDPNRITDPAVLYEYVKKDGGLTLSGMEKLRSEIAGKRTPDGEAEGMLKKQFFANAKGQISGSNEGLHIKDPKGDDLYQRFMVQALADYEKGKKDGKSSSALLNPDSPDYIGKSISTFKRPMSQWFSDTIADAPKPQASQFDPASVASLDDLVRAHQSGQVSAAVARSIAVERGWAKPRPEPISVTLPEPPRR